MQTEFFALQGLSKLVEIVQLLRRRMKPDLEITGVLACMYDNRLRLAREVLAELRSHFPEQLFKRPIAQNVKLAETPSFSRTIFEYAPESKGAEDYLAVAKEFIERETAGAAPEDEPRSVEAPPGTRPGGPHLDWEAAQTLIKEPTGRAAPEAPEPAEAVMGCPSPDRPGESSPLGTDPPERDAAEPDSIGAGAAVVEPREVETPTAAAAAEAPAADESATSGPRTQTEAANPEPLTSKGSPHEEPESAPRRPVYSRGSVAAERGRERARWTRPAPAAPPAP